MVLNKCLRSDVLKTGALVLGTLSILESVGSVIYAIVYGVTVPEDGAAYGFCTLLPIALINLVISNLLVQGVRTEKSLFTLPWLIYEAMTILAQIILVIMVKMFLYAIAIVVSVCFYVCILSYYLQPKEKGKTDTVRLNACEDGKELSSLL